MIIFKQLTILLLIWLAGEIISFFLAGIFLLPGSIIGMIILFILLDRGVLKLEQIEVVSNFILENITFFVIPVGVSLMTSYDLIVQNLIPILLCGVVITFLAMLIIMFFVDKVINRKINREGES